MRALGISGSLRKASLNRAALEAAARLAPDGLTLDVYRGLHDLPLYDSDLDGDGLPTPVRALRASVAAADGLVIASPEYAHGISGPMKNALDWLVGDIDFTGKPIVLWNTAPRATHAQAHLREVLSTMSGRLIEGASLALPLMGGACTSEAIVASADLAPRITHALAALRDAIRGDRDP